ncbi:unnamed protein product [Merluccius merluccius]
MSTKIDPLFESHHSVHSVVPTAGFSRAIDTEDPCSHVMLIQNAYLANPSVSIATTTTTSITSIYTSTPITYAYFTTIYITFTSIISLFLMLSDVDKRLITIGMKNLFPIMMYITL